MIAERRAQILARFGHAAHRFARSGFAATPPEALATREATCRACPEWDAQALNALNLFNKFSRKNIQSTTRG
jgi:hypothetical protein